MALKVHKWDGERIYVEESPARGIVTITLRQFFYVFGIIEYDCAKAFADQVPAELKKKEES